MRRGSLADPLLRAVIIIGAFLFLLHAVLAIFPPAQEVLADISFFVPMFNGFLILEDLTIGFLALGRNRAYKKPISFWTGNAFLFFAITNLFYVLYWPGLLTNGGAILGSRADTSTWVFMIGQIIFGAILIIGSLAKFPTGDELSGAKWSFSVLLGLLASVLVNLLPFWLENRLPLLVRPGGAFSPLKTYLDIFIVAEFFVGVFAYAYHYRKTSNRIAIFMAIFMLLAWSASIETIIEPVRYSTLWYLSKLMSIAGGLVILAGLLWEYVRLYLSEVEKTSLLEQAIAEKDQAEEAMREFNAGLEERIAEQTSQLRAANEELERRVAERTAEVNEINRDLQASRLAALNLLEDTLDSQKKAEEAAWRLRESEERYRSLFNSMTEGFALHEIICNDQGEPVDFRFLDINPAFEKYTGLKREDVVNHTHNEVLPGDNPRWLKEYGAVALKGKAVHFEEYTPNLDEHYEVFAYQPAQGQFAVIFMNVTERKRMEAELEKARRLAEQRAGELDTVFNSIADGIIVYDISGKAVRCNPTAVEMLGVDLTDSNLTDVPKKLSTRTLDGQPLQARNSPTSRALRGQSVVGERYIITNARGEDKTTLVSASPLWVGGKITGVVTAWQDMTEHYKAEEALAVERANLQRIFDAVNVGMLLVDPGGEVQRVNDVIRQWTRKDWADLRSLQPGDALQCIHAVKGKAGCGNTEFCAACKIRLAFESVIRTGHSIHDEEVETTLFVRGKPKSLWLDLNVDPLEVDGKRHAIVALNDITARKEAEQALQLAHDNLEVRVEERTQELIVTNRQLQLERQRFNDVLEKLPAYLILLTPDYHATFANRFFRERFGEANGRPCYKFLFDRDEPCEVCETYKVIKTHQPLNWEWTGPDGHQYDVHDFPFTDVDGSQLILEMGIDITERKQAEAQVKLQTSAMEAAASGIFITDCDGRIQWCNPAFTQMSGYRREEVFGKTPRLLKSGRHSKAFYENLWQTLLSGRVWRGEIINRRKDGSLYTEEQIITPVRNEQGEITHFIAVKEDIQARKEAQEALRLAYAYNRSLLDASLDPLVTISPDGKISDVNPAAEKITGLSQKELIGMDFHNFFTDPQKARLGYQKVFKEGSVRDVELEIRHADGHTTPVLYNASVYRDEKGHVRGIFTISRDISERKRFEDQLVQAEKHAVIGRMVGSVTHEINNPLQTIKNCLYLIQADTPVDSSITEPLDMARSETARLTDLVGQLRELYRPRTDLQAHPHELLDIVEEVHSLLTPHLNNSKVKWVSQRGLKRCYISCVRDQILEVFLNISMNAIEAMQASGGSLSVDMRQDDGHVGIVFKDTGPGVAAEILPHIFEPFQTTKASGLGLGLSISYGIIQRHGGQIVAENAPTGGAIFTVWLPVARKPSKENPDNGH